MAGKLAALFIFGGIGGNIILSYGLNNVGRTAIKKILFKLLGNQAIKHPFCSIFRSFI